MHIFGLSVVFKYVFHICTTCNSIYHWIIEKQFWRHLTNVWRVFLYAWNRRRQSFTDTFSIYSIIFGRWIDIGIGNFALTLSGGISTMIPSSAVTVFTLLQFRYGTLDVLNEQNFTSWQGCRNAAGTYFIMVRNGPLEMDPLASSPIPLTNLPPYDVYHSDFNVTENPTHRQGFKKF